MSEEQRQEENSEVDEGDDEVTETVGGKTEDMEEDRDQDDTEIKDEKTAPKKGRGRPKKKGSQKKPKVDTDEAAVKRGRGRPSKQVVPDPELQTKEEEVDKEAEMEEVSEKKGRGRPKKSAPVKQENVESKASKRGRPQKPSVEDDGDKADTQKAKKPRIKKERSIEPGRLRDTPRLSYKDDSDEELNRYLEPIVDVSSDSEADFTLERRLSGKDRPEQKEAGALRTRKRMSYKDDSDSESGFESDVIKPKKSKSLSKKGRGRPKKQESSSISPSKPRSKSKGKKRGRKQKHPEKGPYVPTGKPRGRKRIHPDTGPYVPTGKPRGRPKGSMKNPAAQSEEDEDVDSPDRTGDQSGSEEPTLTTSESRGKTAADKDTENSPEDNASESGEDNSESGGISGSESEQEEAEIGENRQSAIAS